MNGATFFEQSRARANPVFQEKYNVNKKSSEVAYSSENINSKAYSFKPARLVAQNRDIQRMNSTFGQFNDTGFRSSATYDQSSLVADKGANIQTYKFPVRNLIGNPFK